MAQKRFNALALLLLVSISHLASADFFPDDPDDDLFPERHERARRFIRVFSRKPDPDAEPESGIGFGGHMKNLMKGGTVKFELKIPDNILKFPFFKELDDFPVSREGGGKDPKKDFGMLEREDDYGPLINPRVKGDP